ncbi:MAG: hypothetical protein M1828_001082 [Chrysothrix sp. TS-e1954]|nr:MAG: hypothetical protein M1828_001082 [Chrysothrix sp. TS-e1954]
MSHASADTITTSPPDDFSDSPSPPPPRSTNSLTIYELQKLLTTAIDIVFPKEYDAMTANRPFGHPTASEKARVHLTVRLSDVSIDEILGAVEYLNDWVSGFEHGTESWKDLHTRPVSESLNIPEQRKDRRSHSTSESEDSTDRWKNRRTCPVSVLSFFLQGRTYKRAIAIMRESQGPREAFNPARRKRKKPAYSGGPFSRKRARTQKQTASPQETEPHEHPDRPTMLQFYLYYGVYEILCAYPEAACLDLQTEDGADTPTSSPSPAPEMQDTLMAEAAARNQNEGPQKKRRRRKTKHWVP